MISNFSLCFCNMLFIKAILKLITFLFSSFFMFLMYSVISPMLQGFLCTSRQEIQLNSLSRAEIFFLFFQEIFDAFSWSIRIELFLTGLISAFLISSETPFVSFAAIFDQF